MSERLVIDLLRHGACNDAQIYRGRTDSSLSQLGWAQMHAALAAGQDLRWQRVYSSPLQRCRLPAQLLAERLGLPLQLEVRLQEIDFGSWDGQSLEQIWQQQSAQVQAFWEDPEAFPPPGGESIQSLQQRVAVQVQRWLAACCGAGADTHILCVSHGGVIRALLCQLLKMPVVVGQQLSLDYGSLTRIELYPNAPQEGTQQDSAAPAFYSQVIFINRKPTLSDYGS
ncbi:MAG: histidine phosphatase family protein [Motiliproteus sp.]